MGRQSTASRETRGENSKQGSGEETVLGLETVAAALGRSGGERVACPGIFHPESALTPRLLDGF